MKLNFSKISTLTSGIRIKLFKNSVELKNYPNVNNKLTNDIFKQEYFTKKVIEVFTCFVING